MNKHNELLKKLADKRRKQLMVLRVREKMTDQAIADKIGISRARVQKILGPKK